MSDPAGRRPTRADRDQARALLDAAYTDGRLAEADWALRRGRVAATTTLGDLAALVRDVVQVTPPTDDVQTGVDILGQEYHTAMPGHVLPGDPHGPNDPPPVPSEIFADPADPAAVRPEHRSHFLRPVALAGYALAAVAVVLTVLAMVLGH